MMAGLKISKANQEKYNKIKEELKEQLIEQNKIGPQYDDLLEHAIYLFMIKDVLQEDIQKRGLRIKSSTGNGYKKEDDNKSVEKLLKVSIQLMKVLSDLGLNEPKAIDNCNPSKSSGDADANEDLL
jgi:hypothetical protein